MSWSRTCTKSTEILCCLGNNILKLSRLLVYVVSRQGKVDLQVQRQYGLQACLQWWYQSSYRIHEYLSFIDTQLLTRVGWTWFVKICVKRKTLRVSIVTNLQTQLWLKKYSSEHKISWSAFYHFLCVYLSWKCVDIMPQSWSKNRQSFLLPRLA